MIGYKKFIRFQSKGLGQFVLWQIAKVYLYEKKYSFLL